MTQTYPYSIPSGTDIIPESSGTSSLGSLAYPFASIVTNAISVSGSPFTPYTDAQARAVVSGTSPITVTNALVGISSTPTFTTVNASTLSGTTVSGNNFYRQGVELTQYTDTMAKATISGTGLISVTDGLISTTATNYTDTNARAVISGTSPITVSNGLVGISATPTFTTVYATTFSGSTFSGNTFVGDTRTLNYVIDGGGSVIASGCAGFLEIPYNATPLSWDLIANVSGSLSVDVRRTASYTNWSGCAASTNSIVGTEKPTITTAFKGQDTALTTWSGISAGNILNFHVDATPTNITRATLVLNMRKDS